MTTLTRETTLRYIVAAALLCAAFTRPLAAQDANQFERVLLPVNFTKVSSGGDVHVRSLLSDQFANVPALRQPDSVTMLEEEKIVAYYGAGTLYAKASRLGPML